MIFLIIASFVLIFMWYVVVKSIKENFRKKEIKKVKNHIMNDQEFIHKLNELARGDIDKLTFEFEGKNYNVKQ